jgi:hypothetical protein
LNQIKKRVVSGQQKPHRANHLSSFHAFSDKADKLALPDPLALVAPARKRGTLQNVEM